MCAPAVDSAGVAGDGEPVEGAHRLAGLVGCAGPDRGLVGRGAAGEGESFSPGPRGGRLSVRAADQILGSIADDANIEEFTPHVLRHTFGTRLVRQGHDLVLSQN